MLVIGVVISANVEFNSGGIYYGGGQECDLKSTDVLLLFFFHGYHW